MDYLSQNGLVLSGLDSDGPDLLALSQDGLYPEGLDPKVLLNKTVCTLPTMFLRNSLLGTLMVSKKSPRLKDLGDNLKKRH